MQNGLDRMRSIWAQAKHTPLQANPYLEIAAQAWGTISTSAIEMNPDLCAAFANILQREIEKQPAKPAEPEMSTILFNGTPFTMPRDQAQRLVHAVQKEQRRAVRKALRRNNEKAS